MRRTPLQGEHLARGGKLVDFHGWELPLQFAGIVQEHHHTRAKVSLFDCSHMGEILVRGADAIAKYDRLVISDVRAIRPGRGRYGAILNSAGKIIDDIITIRLGEDEVLAVTNAGPLEQVAALLTQENPGAADISDDTAKIDVQGPGACAAMLHAGIPEAERLRYFEACRTQWRGRSIILSRMGYTGELGYELYIDNDLAAPLWRALLEYEGVAPAGLGARDTLRLEMGYSLSGQDIDETHTPLEAGHAGYVAWDTEFVGKEALLAQREAGGYSVLTPIRTLDRRSPRHGFEVYAPEEGAIGGITSGTFGPSVCHGIGLAYLPQKWSVPGNRLAAGPRGLIIETAELPFYTHGTCRNG